MDLIDYGAAPLEQCPGISLEVEIFFLSSDCRDTSVQPAINSGFSFKFVVQKHIAYICCCRASFTTIKHLHRSSEYDLLHWVYECDRIKSGSKSFILVCISSYTQYDTDVAHTNDKWSFHTLATFRNGTNKTSSNGGAGAGERERKSGEKWMDICHVRINNKQRMASTYQQSYAVGRLLLLLLLLLPHRIWAPIRLICANVFACKL